MFALSPAENSSFIVISERDDAAEAGAGIVGRTSQGSFLATAREVDPVTCASSQLQSVVRLGCPAGRHIRVRGIPTSCPDASASYRLQSSTTVDGRDAVLRYPFEELGCPFSLYYGGDSFRPELELWDGESFVSLVRAEWVIRESNGRDDWGYTATVSDGNCNRHPQTWEGAFTQHPHRDPDDVWLPQDHSKCYDPADPSPQVFSSAPYQIFDPSRNINGLKFTGTEGGMYIFKARIVEPGYSYCNLTVSFGIDVFGAPLPTWIAIVIIVSIVVISLLLLVISYFVYRSNLKSSLNTNPDVGGSGPQGRIYPSDAVATKKHQ